MTIENVQIGAHELLVWPAMSEVWETERTPGKPRDEYGRVLHRPRGSDALYVCQAGFSER